MKIFNGINKYSFETLFGIIEIFKTDIGGESRYMLRMVHQSLIQVPEFQSPITGVIGFGHYPNRTIAAFYLKSIEQKAINILKERCVKSGISL